MLDGRFDPEMARLFRETQAGGDRLTLILPALLQVLRRALCRMRGQRE